MKTLFKSPLFLREILWRLKRYVFVVTKWRMMGPISLNHSTDIVSPILTLASDSWSFLIDGWMNGQSIPSYILCILYFCQLGSTPAVLLHELFRAPVGSIFYTWKLIKLQQTIITSQTLSFLPCSFFFFFEKAMQILIFLSCLTGGLVIPT